jgi:hypothetical protein
MPRTIAACCAILVSGCGTFVFGPPPRIESFTADATTVGWGEPLQLRWHVTGASDLSLSGVSVGGSGAIVRPTAPRAYVLTAHGLGGTVISQPIPIALGPSLAVSAGVMTEDAAQGSIFLARLRSATGAAPSTDSLITIAADAPGFPLQTVCPARAPTCELRAPSLAPAQTFTASAIFEGAKVSTQFALAPGGLASAQGLSASPDGVSWSAVRGAVAYRVQAMDLDSAEPVGAPLLVRGTTAALPAAGSGVWVEALAADPNAESVILPAPHVSRATGFVSAGRLGGAGSGWQIFSPADFNGDTLRASFGTLGADEHLAVLLVNAGGPDRASAQVDVSGTAASAAAPARSPALLASARPVDASHDLARAAQDDQVRAAIAAGISHAAEPRAIAAQESFCTARGLDAGNRVRKGATLALETAHALFYVDNEDAAHYPASFWTTIGALFEDRIYPVDTRVFGAGSDVDGNGKLTIFFPHELGAHLNGGWLIGYFGNNDLLRARDGSGDCGGTASNHADMLYMNDIANGQANGFSPDDLAASVFPATIAHELQHLINLNQRCLLRSCSEPEATWVNEGLSKVAEDLTGFGWNGGQGRWEGSQYLARSSGELQGYDGRSLTRWEGDPIGNYQAAHSFMRYFTDRAGGSFAGNLAQQQGLARTLGMPLPRALAEWATALLFSNEANSPLPTFSYSGTGWSPFHSRLRHLDFQDLPPGGVTASLRADGFDAFISGNGQAGPASITVRSGADVKPHVVVVKFSGALPRD